MMTNLVILDKKYILTDEGRLFNRTTGEEFIPTCDGGGYQQLCRYIDGIKKSVKIHQLVMYYFGPPKPGNNYEIDHFNRNKLDNAISNLRWVTHQENEYNVNRNLEIGKRACDYNSNEEYHKEYSKEWQQSHKESTKKAAFKYSKSEKGKKYQKQWYEDNKDKRKQTSLKSNRKRRAKAKGFDSWEEYQAHKHALN